MSTKKQKPPPAPKKHEPDWAALEALTDEEIDAQIAADPDVAPEWGWPLDDPHVRIMVPTDVKAIRAKFGMSQQRFAKAFALNLATLRDWEQERRMPHGPARTLLQMMARPRATSDRTKSAGRPRKVASTPKTEERQTAGAERRHAPARRAAAKA
jgi:putative transcriptional regulator